MEVAKGAEIAVVTSTMYCICVVRYESRLSSGVSSRPDVPVPTGWSLPIGRSHSRDSP